jgi:hypothetical protein
MYLYRDFYGLNLFAVNQILNFACYPLVRNSLDFDIIDFTRHLSELSSLKSPTAEQQLVIVYYNFCKKRLIDKDIIDCQNTVRVRFY